MKKYFLLFLISLSGISHAGQFAVPSSSTYGKIVYIRAYGNTDAPNMPTYIQIEGAPIKSTCPHQDFGKGDLNYWLIDPEEKHLLSLALMAYTSKTPVKITSNDSTSKMKDGSCRVVYIDLKS